MAIYTKLLKRLMLNLQSCNNCDIVVTNGQAISSCQNKKLEMIFMKILCIFLTVKRFLSSLKKPSNLIRTLRFINLAINHLYGLFYSRSIL